MDWQLIDYQSLTKIPDICLASSGIFRIFTHNKQQTKHKKQTKQKQSKNETKRRNNQKQNSKKCTSY